MNTVESYKDILALAKVAQKSCDASTRTIGRDVQKLFPSSMIRTEEQPWEEYNAEGTTAIIKNKYLILYNLVDEDAMPMAEDQYFD